MIVNLPRLTFCLGIGLVAGFGCSQGPSYDINPEVRGKITLDGKPLANVIVEFYPEPAKNQPNVQCPISRGETDESGNFDLSYSNNGTLAHGAVVGKQTVVVIAGRSGSERNGEPARPTTEAAKKNPPIPQQFSIASQSPHKEEITKDKHDYQVQLSSSGGKVFGQP